MVGFRLKQLMLGAILLATPLAAQAQVAQQRVLEVPSIAKWQHAETGLIIPRSLAGLQRTAITDAISSEIDVSVQFGNADTTLLTLFLFRPALWNVPVWFDRAEAQILNRDVYGGAVPAADPIAFSPTQTSTPSALRRIYTPAKLPYKATAVAIIPLPQWLVAIRISSRTLDPAALDAALVTAIDEVGWPAPTPGAAALPAAVPLRPCATTLTYSKKAKLKKPDMTQGLLGAVLAGVVSGQKVEHPAEVSTTNFCREGPGEPTFAVYRVVDGTEVDSDGYVIALSDAGRTISVHPEFSLHEKHAGYAVTLNELDRNYVYPAFDKLPDPGRVVEAISKTSPVSSSTLGGKDVDVVVEH